MKVVKFILKKLFFFIYDIIFFLGIIVYLPVYFWRKKITIAALKQKFGFIAGLGVKDSIWIQVVLIGTTL